MSQSIAENDGYFARMEDRKRNPPPNFRDDLAQAWLGGWDQCDKELKQKQAERQKKIDKLPEDWRTQTHPNGRPMWSPDGTLLDDKGNRSIFDDVDE